MGSHLLECNPKAAEHPTHIKLHSTFFSRYHFHVITLRGARVSVCGVQRITKARRARAENISTFNKGAAARPASLKQRRRTFPLHLNENLFVKRR